MSTDANEGIYMFFQDTRGETNSDIGYNPKILFLNKKSACRCDAMMHVFKDSVNLK